MSGIYIHIPFCRHACDYCNFHFATSLRQKPELVEALQREIALTPFHSGDAASRQIGTLYFGGGTPSLLTDSELNSLLEAVQARFSLAADAEITLEANPDDIRPAQLQAWSGAGINRLSIGIQSFSDADLQWMQRGHSAADALRCIETVREAGYNRFSIDLIYGTPGLTDEQWAQHLETAIRLQVPHLSCYALTVEPRTPLEKKIRLQRKADVDPEQQARQFLLAMDRLQEAGYEHYEISNWALPGQYSRHNRSYWEGVPYYGFGPSAHAFDGSRRRWNVANNAAYIRALAGGELPFEEEVLTAEQQFNEYIMTALRTDAGISLSRLEKEFGPEKLRHTEAAAAAWLSHGQLKQEDGRLILTREGKLFADGISAGLFWG